MPGKWLWLRYVAARLLSAAFWKRRLAYGWALLKGPAPVDFSRVKCLPVAAPSSNALCLFALYAPNGDISAGVRGYLSHLAEIAVDVALLSNGPIAPAALESARPLCRWIVERENRGADFAAWRVGWECTRHARGYRHLLLANDSVHGPFRRLDGIISAMRRTGCDLWGITDSPFPKWHLMSYFLWTEERVFRSDAWRLFWERVGVYDNKQALIRRLEVGLSQAMLAAGFKLASYAPYHEVRAKDSANPLNIFPNVAIANWRCLIRDFGVPFVKRSVFDPKTLENIRSVSRDLADYHVSGYIHPATKRIPYVANI